MTGPEGASAVATEGSRFSYALAMNRPFRLRSRSDVLATAAVLLMGVAASAGLSEVAIRLLGLDSFRLELVIWDAFGPTARYDYRLRWANLPGSLGYRPPAPEIIVPGGELPMNHEAA